MPEPLDSDMLNSLISMRTAIDRWFDRVPGDQLEALGFHSQLLGKAINAQIDHYCQAHRPLPFDMIMFTLCCVLTHRATHPHTPFDIRTYGEENADA